jgi:transaldolase/glucose-6-phosphate isomerase
VASVASFFVSRIDTLVDQQLEMKLRGANSDEEKQKITGLLSKVAIANAKLAYRRFKEIFSAPRFKALAQMGARVQRMLWASTSTKNPKYSDVLYVENLIGPDTINTMPSATMSAFRDHGKVRPTVEEGLDDCRRVFAQLEEVGIDLRAITQRLEDQGVELFAKDFKKLLDCVADKRQRLASEEGLQDVTISGAGLPQAVHAALQKLDEQKIGRRVWDRDPAVWKSDPASQKVIRNALGWLTVSQPMLEHLDAVTSFVQEAKRAGFTHAVLLGMGGSSLCPDVCRATFGMAPGFLELHVLDSTVPASVTHIEDSVDLPHTLFIVSSKSGGTAETLSFFKYFYERLRILKGASAGENFVAITDSGTSLERQATEKDFRHIFHGHADIGGRYSALSNFGMVPAALIGVDTRALLDRAERMVHACGSCVPAGENPGLRLGAALGEAARMGRDKVTFVISPGIATFADWVEQLIAESTGKEGKGILPIAGEKLGEPSVYGNDRIFVHIKLASDTDESSEQGCKALEAAGHPVIRIALRDTLDLGSEFFRWEMATATAGFLLGINPFDQPNVQESKDNTNGLLERFRSEGKLGEDAATLESDDLKFFCDSDTRARLEKIQTAQRGVGKSPEGYLTAFLSQAQPGDYIALMAYLQPTSKHTEILQSIRTRLRNATGLATTLGYGPRFLHSTGQLHKGGPNNGLFIQITADDEKDLPVPGEPYSFSVLKHAQALGDLRSLASKQRRVIRLHLAKDVDTLLARLDRLVENALKPLARARAS